MLLSLNLYNTHASFLLTPLSTKSTAVTLLTNRILPLRNHIHRDNIFRTKSKEHQSILPLLCCLSQKGIEISTRTTVLQMHTRQWVGTYAGRGNGDYRCELASALQAITTYLKHFAFSPEVALVRLDGQYGDAVVIAQLIGAGVYLVTRGRGYQLLEHPQIQRILAHPP